MIDYTKGKFWGVLTCGLCTALFSLVSTATIARAGTPCTSAEYRQMDYFLGTWIARNPKGEIRGKADVRKILNGCAIQFSWIGVRYSGIARDAYDAGRAKWEKAWVDSTGYVEISEGFIKNNEASFTGADYDNGKIVGRHREHLTLLGPGRVRFLYEVSSDGGHAWSQASNTTYTKVTREQYDRMRILQQAP